MAGKKEEQSQVRTILADTIIALCKNTLGYRAEVCVEGLLGITLDNEDIFLVNIKETIKKQGADVMSGEREGAEVSDSEGSSSGESHGEDSESKSRRRKRKRRKRSRDNENMTLALESESIDDSDKRQKLETAGDSENDNMAKNVKHESANYDDEDDELVFVKEEPVEDSNSSFGHSQMLGFDGGQSGDSLVETSISAAQLQQLTSQLAASGSTSMDSAVPGTSSQLSGSPGGSTGQYGAAKEKLTEIKRENIGTTKDDAKITQEMTTKDVASDLPATKDDRHVAMPDGSPASTEEILEDGLERGESVVKVPMFSTDEEQNASDEEEEVEFSRDIGVDNAKVGICGSVSKGQSSAEDRPESLSQILEMLKGLIQDRPLVHDKELYVQKKSIEEEKNAHKSTQTPRPDRTTRHTQTSIYDCMSKGIRIKQASENKYRKPSTGVHSPKTSQHPPVQSSPVHSTPVQSPPQDPRLARKSGAHDLRSPKQAESVQDSGPVKQTPDSDSRVLQDSKSTTQDSRVENQGVNPPRLDVVRQGQDPARLFRSAEEGAGSYGQILQDSAVGEDPRWGGFIRSSTKSQADSSTGRIQGRPEESGQVSTSTWTYQAGGGPDSSQEIYYTTAYRAPAPSTTTSHRTPPPSAASLADFGADFAPFITKSHHEREEKSWGVSASSTWTLDSSSYLQRPEYGEEYPQDNSQRYRARQPPESDRERMERLEASQFWRQDLGPRKMQHGHRHHGSSKKRSPKQEDMIPGQESWEDRIADLSFKCRFCKRNFRLKSKCQAHEKVHTGEASFQCSFCSEKFITKLKMKRHEMICPHKF